MIFFVLEILLHEKHLHVVVVESSEHDYCLHLPSTLPEFFPDALRHTCAVHLLQSTFLVLEIRVHTPKNEEEDPILQHMVKENHTHALIQEGHYIYPGHGPSGSRMR